MKGPHCCRHALFLLATAALLFPARPVAGQRVLKDGASDIRHGLGDMVHVWTAPARMRTSDLEGLAVVIGVGGLLLASDRRIQNWVDDHPSSAVVEALRPFREEEPLEQVGDIWFTFRYAGAAWLAGLAFDSETVREAAMGCLSAGVAQTLPRRLIAHGIVARTRPRFTDDPWRFDLSRSQEWERRSFPGGHAANAFTCISFLGNRYALGALEPVLYAAATGAALARVPDRAHWASDTWLGIALGYAVGRAVAHRALDRANPPASPSPEDRSSRTDPGGLDLGWTPDGLRLSYRVRF